MKKLIKYYIMSFVFILLLIPNLTISSFYFNKIYTIENLIIDKKTSVAIVFGAGVIKKNPSAIFEDRLLVAKNLYDKNIISKILISGDNSKPNYNEPLTGKNFLLKNNVKEKDIILDFAGLRTYDTCVRANKIWDIEKAYLITQKFHLSRALFICNNTNVKSVGVSASLRSYKDHYKNIVRETLAQQKAFYEVYFFPHNPKFLGKKESLE
jgi:SanA protein